ncbi:hypothetical protein V7166_21910 [Bacillus thuringiensis]
MNIQTDVKEELQNFIEHAKQLKTFGDIAFEGFKELAKLFGFVMEDNLNFAGRIFKGEMYLGFLDIQYNFNKEEMFVDRVYPF